MFTSRPARMILIAACAAVSGCAAAPDAETKMSADADARYRDWLVKHEVPGSHDGKWTSYEAMHRFFVDSFVKSEGFGYERLPTPELVARRSVLSVNGQSYAIGGVDLISLGRKTEDGTAGEPFVYTTSTPTRFGGRGDVMKSRLGKTKTREPIAFEIGALAKLREGEDSVMGGEQDKPALVGAVRATTSCLSCHKVEEGTLLGAFSYPLVPVGAESQFY